jgi:uncharacterized repeat protein (TIGR01451 family)/fimbrial isopeptide formation D2 family protein
MRVLASLFDRLNRRDDVPARSGHDSRRLRSRRRLHAEQLERRLALAATPTASVTTGSDVIPFLGAEIPLTVSFDNTGSDIGYGPFVDVIMPAAGDAPPLPENGIAFKPGSASYLGIPLTPTVLTFGPTGQVNHPFAKDSSGNPVVISGGVGDQLVVFQLPFGSYGPDQPPAAINFTGMISGLAQPSTTYDIAATGGFQFQVDGAGNPTVNIADFGTPATDPVEPQLFVIEKDSSAPEDETATGPNFQHTYTVNVSVAPGQTLTNFALTDVLPANVQFVAVTGATANGASVITPTSTPDTTVPGGTLAYLFDQVVGTGGSDITVTYTFFMPEKDAAGADVIPLGSGGAAAATNTVGGSATWTSPNPNFPDPQFVVGDPVSYTVTGKTLALQKSASPFQNAKAGDTVTYTLSFQLSDYFALGGFVIDDLLSDGQDFDASFTPHLSFTQKGQTFTAQPFDAANFTVDATNPDGTTTVDFDVAAQLAALGLATGTNIVGAGIPNTGTGGPEPDPLPGGPGTTGTITFQTKIRNTYRATSQEVVQGDVVSNTALTGGTVLDFTDLDPTASTFSDGSNATVTLAVGTLDKTVHAVNGGPVAGIPVVTAGDAVTFRITYALPFSSIGQYTLTDFLPLPIFEAGPLTYAGGGPSGTLPGVGEWSFGPLDTFFGISGIVPTTAADTAANSVSWDFGTFQDSFDRSAVTDIFFTVAATNRPFADGLLLTNQAQQTEVTTDGRTLSATDIAQVRIAEPLLGITKGVVSTDNPAGVFTPSPVAPAGVVFAPPGQAGAAFTGTITSAGLAATPIDAALSNVLGNDLVKFTIIVENTGSGPDGAYNVTFQDTFDATKFRIPGGSTGLNLQITDGAGTPLAYTGDLFAGGITLVDGATSGALAPGKTTAGVPIETGRNIAVISYDLELLDTVVPLDVIPNTATLDRYTSTPDPSSPNFVPPGGISDTTTVTVMAPEAAKKLIDTSIIDDTNGRTQAVVGELATFELTILVPEGTTPDAVVVDALPAGLAFVQMVGSPVIDPGVSFTGSADPVISNDGRTMTFNLGDIVNSNPDRQLHGITVRYETVVLNVATNVSNAQLRNSATFSWDNGDKSLPAAQSDSPVIVIEPKLRLRKTPDVRTAEASDLVTWTIVVSHASNSQTDAFNVSLSDVIPAGLTYVPGSLANTAGVVPTSLTPAGGSFTVTYDELPFGQTSTLTFQTTVDSSVVAGASIVNRARATWTSLAGDPGQITPNNPNAYERTGGGSGDPGQLNNYVTTGSGTITVAQPEVAKTLVTTSIVNASNSATQAVIGETAIYTVTLTVPQGTMPAATLVDVLPAGMAFVELVGTPVVDPAISFTGSLVPVVASGGQTITFNLGDVTNSDTDSTQPETIEVTFRAVVLNVGGNVSGTQLVNRSRATWNSGANTTPFASSGPVTVIEPKLQTTKTVAVGGFGGNVGDPVTYTITIRQAASSDTDAFDVSFLDELPAKIASPALVSVVDTAGIVTAGDFSLTGSTLTGGGFDLPKLPAGRTITLTVSGTLAAPLSATETIANTASTRWTSLDGDPGQITPNNSNAYERTGGGSADPGQLNNYVASGTATITPNSADLAIVKTVSNATPNVGDTISFTITLSNLGPNVAHGVEVTDQLPAGLQFVSATPSQGSFDPGTGIWEVGTVAVGPAAAQTLTIQALVLPPTTPGAIPAAQTNVATVTASDEPDPNPGNNTGTSTVTPLYADLGVKKTTSNVQPNVGDTITYTVQLFNLGTAAATNVTVTDSLPANVSFVSATPAAGTTFTPSATGGDWTVPVILPGQTLLLTITVQATDSGRSFNTVTITGSDVYDPNDRNNTARTPTDPQEADLIVKKTVDNARPQVGVEVTFTITLDNLGPNSAQNVVVTDLLPAGLDYVSHTASDGAYDSGTGEWTLGTVAGGAVETLTITALVLTPSTGPATPQTNTATATSDTTDPNPDNNTSESTVTPLQADLAIFKVVDDPTPNVGQTIEFTITVTNLGPDLATGVVVTDVLPAGLTFVSATASQGSYAEGTGLWTVGTVASADFPTLVIRAVVDQPASGPPAPITNSVTVNGNEYDPDPGNNEDDVTVTPQYADLAVTKTVDDATPNVGDLVTFTITLENLGVDTATNVTLRDVLPAGLELVTALPSQGTYDPGTGIWTVGTVDTLFARTLSVQAIVLAPASGVPQPQTNTVAVATVDQYDPDPDNDEADVTVTPQYADLAVTKTVDEARPNVGDTISFTVTLENLGVDTATGVTVVDSLPDGLSFVAATPEAGTSYDPTTGIWTVGTLAPAATVTLLIEAEVVSGLPQTNTATVTTADQFDPDPTNNTDNVTETPLTADLAIAKSVNDPAPILGDTVTYTIVVTNAGPDSALNVIATERFPLDGLSDITAGSPSQGSFDASTGLWLVGDLAAGASATITFTAVASAVGDFTNTATVSSTTFDPDIENNESSVTIEVRPAGIILGTDFGCNSGPLVRVVDPRDGSLRAEFYAYEPNFRGGVRVYGADITGDGIPEIITAPGPGRPGEVRVFDRNGTPLPEYNFFPFGAGYRSGVEVAAGSVTGPGRFEIVAGQSRGQSLVRVFTVNPGEGVDSQAIRQLQPFGRRYRGGVTVATADVGTFNGGSSVSTSPDGISEIIIGSGGGIPAQVQAFNAVPAQPVSVGSFRAIGARYRGGVSVSKLPGADGVADRVLVAGGRRSGGQVQTWRHDGSRFVRDAAFAAFGGSSAAVFAAATDAENIFTVEGVGGRRPGVRKNTAPSGGTESQVPQTSTFAPPLRVSVLRA